MDPAWWEEFMSWAGWAVLVLWGVDVACLIILGPKYTFFFRNDEDE